MADGQRFAHTVANSISVSDDTPTTLLNIPIPPGHTAVVTIEVVGQDKGVVAGKAALVAYQSVRNHEGTVTFADLVDGGADVAFWTYQMDPGMVTLSASGNNLRVTFTGAVATNIVVAAWATTKCVEAAVSES